MCNTTHSSEQEPCQESPAAKAKAKGKGKKAEDAEAALWERVPTFFSPYYLLFELTFVGTEYGGKICKGSVISKLNREYLLSELKLEEQISFPVEVHLFGLMGLQADAPAFSTAEAEEAFSVGVPPFFFRNLYKANWRNILLSYKNYIYTYMWNRFGESVNQEHHAHVWISSIRTDIWACFFHARVWTCCHGEKIHTISSIWSEKWVGFTRTLAHRPQIHQQLQKQLPRQRRTFFPGDSGYKTDWQVLAETQEPIIRWAKAQCWQPRGQTYTYMSLHTHIYIYIHVCMKTNLHSLICK